MTKNSALGADFQRHGALGECLSADAEENPRLRRCFLSCGDMLTALTRYAHWLDLWLHKHIGRPYEGILSIGLGLSIVASVNSLSHIIAAGGAPLQSDLVKTVGIVVFQVALLINQLA